MEELKIKIEDFLSKIDINSILLLKIISVLFIVNIAMFFYNISFNNDLYNKFKQKVDEKKVLVVDNNGNQYFKRIGYLNEDTIEDFAVIGIRKLIEYAYNDKKSLLYAKKYASFDIYNKLKNKIKKEEKQLELDEGYYTIQFKSIKFEEINEKNEIWKLQAYVMKKYNGLGIDKQGKYESVKIKIEYKSNLLFNPLGLIITGFEERELTEKELEKLMEK